MRINTLGIVVGVCAVLSIFTFFKALFFDKESIISAQKESVILTQMAIPAFNLFWHEERFRNYQPPRYAPYPEMPSTYRLDFVYNIRSKKVDKK